MGEHILLVEDEEKLARMVEMELKYEGYTVEKAFDGRKGLDRALSGEFDLILLDIMLPQLSGMEVLRRLRQRLRAVPGSLPAAYRARASDDADVPAAVESVI